MKKTSTNYRGIHRFEIWGALAWLSLILGVAILLIPVALQVRTQYSFSQFLPKDHALLRNDAEVKSKFFIDEYQPILVSLTLPSGDWLETRRLQSLKSLSDEVAKLENTSGAVSLGSVEIASQTNDGSQASLQVSGLLGIHDENARRERVMRDRFLKPLLIAHDGRKTLLVVRVKPAMSPQESASLVQHVKASAKVLIPDATVAVGGVQAIQSQLTTLVKSELARFMGLALLASSLSLFLVFSTASSLLVPFVAILVSNLLVLAFISVMGFSMTVLSVTIPIIVSVDVLSLVIHALLRYVEDGQGPAVVSPGLSTRASHVWKSFKAVFFANLTTSLTTCFGFATLALTKVPLIREFGIAVSTSIMISWLATTLTLLPMMLLLPMPQVRTWVLKEARWTNWIMSRARPIVASVVVVCLVLGLVGQNLSWSAKLFDDLPDGAEARLATEDIDRDLGGTVPLELLVEAKEGVEYWNEPEAVRRLDQLLIQMRSHPEVGSATGLPDLLRLSMGDPEALIPESRSVIAENWFLMSMAENNILKSFLSADGQVTRLSLRLRDVENDRMERVIAAIEGSVQAAFPQARVVKAGMSVSVPQLNKELSRSLLNGFWEALAAISLLLLLLFRSVRWTFLAMLPNLVPAAVLIGLLAILETPMKPGVAIVFSIALGIAFNNTVYLLQRLRTLMAETGLSPDEEIERTLRLEGNPCLVASACLIAGFGIFLLSDFGINRTFGAYMLVSLLFGLVGDLVFLPALVKIAPWILVSNRMATQPKVKIVPPAMVEEDLNSEDGMLKKPATQKDSTSEAWPRIAAALAAVVLASSIVSPAMAKSMDANEILKRVELGLLAKDERAFVKLKVIESNGSSKERQLEIKRKSGAKHQVLVRLKAPSDVSGIGLLSVSKAGSDDQWLYMPSQRKARRVVSGNRSQRFLDTEFSLEDFSASTYSRFSNKLIKEERAPSAAIAVIESLAKDGSSSYSKIVSWVDLATYQVQKSEYYDQQGKLLKTMVFRNYKKFGSAWRAQAIEVRNMQNQRSTLLTMANLKLNSGLSDREFSQSALEQED